MKSPLVLTIGHSNHSLDAFVALLQAHQVDALADVRSAPYSRFAPQFNKDSLQGAMKAHDIKYVFLGRELGARPQDPACYANGRVQYDRLARTDLFVSGLTRIIRGAAEHRIALMCAEKEPLECHRTLLVGRALDERGIAVEHILPDGRLETHADAMARLMTVVGLPAEDLFLSREELVAEALARQEDRIAYADESVSSEVREQAQ
jgi:uncharacterized protein (DUF488 family)